MASTVVCGKTNSEKKADAALKFFGWLTIAALEIGCTCIGVVDSINKKKQARKAKEENNKKEYVQKTIESAADEFFAGVTGATTVVALDKADSYLHEYIKFSKEE